MSQKNVKLVGNSFIFRIPEGLKAATVRALLDSGNKARMQTRRYTPCGGLTDYKSCFTGFSFSGGADYHGQITFLIKYNRN